MGKQRGRGVARARDRTEFYERRKSMAKISCTSNSKPCQFAVRYLRLTSNLGAHCILPFTGVCLLHFCQTASLFAQSLLENVIANVQANESLYENIEVVWNSELQRADTDALHPQSLARNPNVLVRKYEGCRYIRQDGMFFFEINGSKASTNRETPKIHRVRGFDGRVTRYLEHRGSYVGNIIKEPAPDSSAFHPHLLPLRNQWVNVPFSVWLQGAEAIRAHPDGNLDETTDLRITYDGEEEVQGLVCAKVKAEYLLLGDKPRITDHRIFWLAIHRNYLPVKAVGYRHFDSPDLPTEKTEITELREIESGVWYPFQAVYTLYDAASLRENHEAVVSARTVHTIEKADLDPDYPVSLFRDIEFPDGTPVYEIENGEIVNSYARAQSTENLREKVLDAWQRRQNSVESATFRIRSTLVLTENELLGRRHRLQTLHGKEPNPKEIPQSDKILIELYEVAFDGDKLRFFMTFDKSTHEIAKSVNRNMTLLYVTNGADYRCLESFPDQGVNSGVIQNADQFLAFKSAEVKPIMQAFRAFLQQRRQLIDNLKVVDGEHEIDGRSVVVMQQHYDGAGIAGEQYWTDPSREYLVLRNLAMIGDSQVGSQTDIEYEQDNSGQWVPVKWVTTDFDSDGDLRRSYEFQVVEYEINPKLPEDLFELEFAPGIEVYDKRKGVGSRVNIWTVNKDGTKNMKRGVDPDKSDDFTTPRRGWPAVLLWINGSIVLFLVIFFVLRRRLIKLRD